VMCHGSVVEQEDAQLSFMDVCTSEGSQSGEYEAEWVALLLIVEIRIPM